MYLLDAQLTVHKKWAAPMSSKQGIAKHPKAQNTDGSPRI